MQKMVEARTRDHRRPKRAVNGHMKKHAKKAGDSQLESRLLHDLYGHGLPPACKRLVEFELTLTLCFDVYLKSCWKDGSVRTPPTTPVSYAKRKDPMQHSVTR